MRLIARRSRQTSRKCRFWSAASLRRRYEMAVEILINDVGTSRLKFALGRRAASARSVRTFRFICRWCFETGQGFEDKLLPGVHHLRRRFARFKLCAHLLDLRCLLFHGCC